MNYKNTLIAILSLAALIFSIFTISVASADSFSVSAKAAVLYEPETKTFLYKKNANTRLPMASTTKIMTAVVALENADIDDIIIVDSRAVGIEGSSAYLSLGDTYTLSDMLYALLLQSANDAAVAIACGISGSVDAFVELMNEKAAELELADTHFENPSGLDSPEHYTTAHDLALIAAHALKNEKFKEITSTYKKRITPIVGSERLFVNHNKLLKLYDDAIGVKTGFTKKSGRCLVGAAERCGLSFITVTLDAPNDWSDHEKMLDFGFESLENRVLADVGEYSFDIPIIGAENQTVHAENTEAARKILKKSAKNITKDIELIRYGVAPIKKGDILGKITFSIDGEIIYTLNIAATEDIKQAKKENMLSKLLDKFKKS